MSALSDRVEGAYHVLLRTVGMMGVLLLFVLLVGLYMAGAGV